MYTALSSLEPVLAAAVDVEALAPAERFRWHRRFDAWKYGSGLDYESHKWGYDDAWSGATKQFCPTTFSSEQIGILPETFQCPITAPQQFSDFRLGVATQRDWLPRFSVNRGTIPHWTCKRKEPQTHTVLISSWPCYRHSWSFQAPWRWFFQLRSTGWAFLCCCNGQPCNARTVSHTRV